MSDPKITEIDRFEAPYRRELVLQDVVYESDMRLLRVRIREGHRFTILDIDAPTVERWAKSMLAWCQQAAPAPGQ